MRAQWHLLVMVPVAAGAQVMGTKDETETRNQAIVKAAFDA